MTIPQTEITPYCTDEDLAVQASGDFVTLVPSDQKVAVGTDGVFTGGARWVLTSATVDFEDRGVQVGMACLLTKPTATFRVPGDLLVVKAVDGGSLTLGRKGMTVGVGEPPGPAAGVTAVEFAVITMLPQILHASYDIDQRYGTDDLVYGRRHVDQYDPRQLKDLTVKTVLGEQYLAMARSSKDSDHLYAKAREHRRAVEELVKRVSVLWVNAPVGNDRTNPFGIRAVRG